ncbi:MAG: hypothetical protein HGA23_03395 [Bacteroidales bacterium]|nr:hypothetical protein [Bacteroidales bacterium]
MPEIKIGQSVDIVVEHGVIKPSSVQDIMEDRIVLLQIVPPLPEKCINKTILVTYLTLEDRYARRCFEARIVEIREGYVTVGRGFPAIIVERIPPDVTCDLRVHERQRPQPAMKIMLDDDCLEIVNISISGAHLVRTARKRVILKVGDTILLTVQDGNDISYRYARIIRQWHSKGADGPEHLAVIFTAEKIIGK